MNNQPNNQNQNNQQNNQQQPQGNQNTNTPKQAVVVDDTTGRKQNMMKLGSIILVIVVILALANGKWAPSKSKTSEKAAVTAELPEGCKPGFLFSETSGKPCPAPAETTDIAAPAVVATPAASSGYDDAIKLYAGKVVSFDAECKALPAVATFAPGTRILVANNSKATLSFKMLGMTKELRPYHYFLTNLKDSGVTTISCNGDVTSTLTVK
jgi:hypothetical protein